MATIYVDSAAGGANNGTSWADAYTSIASTTGAAAGDTVLIDDGHSQTGALGTLNFASSTLANPVRILCVDKADDSLSTGAALTNNSGVASLQGHIVGHGLVVTQSANAFLQLALGTESFQKFSSCQFVHTGSSSVILASGLRSLAFYTDCTIDFSGGTSAGATAQAAGAASLARLVGGVVKARSAGHTTLFFGGTSGAVVELEGVDIQNTVTNLYSNSGGAGRFAARRCTVPSFTNLMVANSTLAQALNYGMLEGCKSGTISAPALGLTWLENRCGTVKSDLTRYRTGGADDGEQANPHSWSMASNANCLEQVSWLESPPIAVWVEAGSQTITLYLASGATLQDDEFWIDVLSPSEAGSATTQGRAQSTRLAFQGTPANLASDGASTWNGSGVGTKQKVSVSIAPTVPGWVEVRCCLAKPSTTAYVDPVIEVS